MQWTSLHQSFDICPPLYAMVIDVLGSSRLSARGWNLKLPGKNRGQTPYLHTIDDRSLKSISILVEVTSRLSFLPLRDNPLGK